MAPLNLLTSVRLEAINTSDLGVVEVDGRSLVLKVVETWPMLVFNHGRFYWLAVPDKGDKGIFLGINSLKISRRNGSAGVIFLARRDRTNCSNICHTFQRLLNKQTKTPVSSFHTQTKKICRTCFHVLKKLWKKMADVYGGRLGVSLDFPIAASSPWPGFPHAALMARTHKNGWLTHWWIFL